MGVAVDEQRPGDVGQGQHGEQDEPCDDDAGHDTGTTPVGVVMADECGLLPPARRATGRGQPAIAGPDRERPGPGPVHVRQTAESDPPAVPASSSVAAFALLGYLVAEVAAAAAFAAVVGVVGADLVDGSW